MKKFKNKIIYSSRCIHPQNHKYKYSYLSQLVFMACYESSFLFNIIITKRQFFRSSTTHTITSFRVHRYLNIYLSNTNLPIDYFPILEHFIFKIIILKSKLSKQFYLKYFYKNSLSNKMTYSEIF